MARLPSLEYLLECFDYDKTTDTLTWRKRPYRHFDSKGACRTFNTKFSHVEIKHQITIGNLKTSKSKVAFKIVHGFEPPKYTHQKGCIIDRLDGYMAQFKCDKKRFLKLFKTEIEAQEWLKEMRVKFEKNELPIVKYNKVPKSGFYGVHIINGAIHARIGYKRKQCIIGRFNTEREASNAYQIAKQQIKDGVFIPHKKIENPTGFVGVYMRGKKFNSKYQKKHIGTFNTAEEAHAAYLKAKNHKTFDDGLDILAKLAKEYR